MMNSRDVQTLIDDCHKKGKKVAIHFCSHIPLEITEAAGIASLRLPYVDGVADAASRILPTNVCAIVKNCCDICEDDCTKDADILLAETSCDGKRKMYELLSDQDRVYYYQVPQGEDRDYSNPLIYSECKYLVRELERRFDVEITPEAIREAARLAEQERASVRDLMEIQKQTPPAAWGLSIYQALEEHRILPDIRDRIAANRKTREELLAQKSPVGKRARRILVTGCPLSGLYEKVLRAVENNGGVVVCIENCEVMKSAVRRFDPETEDVYQALADCYQDSACAIMSPNRRRFQLIEHFIDEYQVDGVLDVHLQVCHPYTVEKDKLSRVCYDLGVPYQAVTTDTSASDTGQLETRIAAFIEMLSY